MPDPDWSFTLAEATVTLDDYARMKHVAFRAGHVPLLYSPYLIWPTKEDRASGMLVPGIGYSNQRGFFLGLSYFWVTGRPTDQTIHLDAYTDGSVGGGLESRWRPTDESAGLFQGYVIRDQNATVCVPLSQIPPDGGQRRCAFCRAASSGVYTDQPATRWKLRLDHVADDLPFGFRGVLSIRDYSDQQYLQDYERSFALNSARQIVSRGFLTKNFGADSLNVRFERSETFYSSTVIQERFPTVEFFHRTAQIGHSGLYLSLLSSLSGLYMNRGRDLTARHAMAGSTRIPSSRSRSRRSPGCRSRRGRAGASRSTRTRSWFRAASSRASPSRGPTGRAGVSFVGPSFSRIYDTSIGSVGQVQARHRAARRLPVRLGRRRSGPHPGLRRGRQRSRPEPDPLCDRQPPARAHRGRQGLGRGDRLARDRADLRLRFPADARARAARRSSSERPGPYEALLRISRPGLLHVDGRLAYDPYANQLTTASVTAGATWGSNYLNASWFGARPVIDNPIPGFNFNSDQLRVSGGVDLGKYFRFDGAVAYDATANTWQEDRGLLTYKGSCYTVFLEVRQLRLPPAPRNDYRLVVNLKDIGTILDVNGSIDALLGF